MNGIRYDSYKMTYKEAGSYLAIGLLLDGIVSYLFYRSYIAFLIFLPAIYFYMKKIKKDLLKKRRGEFSLQFKEAIMAVSASLNAGYSVENSFIEAAKDLRNLYGKKAIMVQEFGKITGRLGANENLEDILTDLANRSNVEDVRDFADVFITAKKSGGDLAAIIRRTAYHIGDKIEVKRDIDTLMSAKRMEQNVMNVIPFGMILYMSISSPGFLDPLYGNIAGILIMTLCLILYAAALALADRIVSVEV